MLQLRSNTFLTAAVPDDQVSSLLQVDGQQEGPVWNSGVVWSAGALIHCVKLDTQAHTEVLKI